MRLDHLLSKENCLLFNFESSLIKMNNLKEIAYNKGRSPKLSNLSIGARTNVSGRMRHAIAF